MKKIFLLLMAHACVFQLWAQGSLQLTAGANIRSSNGGYIVLENMNISNDGSFKQAAGDGFVKLTGAIDVSLLGGGITIIDNLLLAKTAPATLNLQTNISIVSKVNFSGGLLNLNDKILDLGTTGILTSESNFSRAFTDGTGYIESMGILNSNLPAPGNSGNFGLGNLGAVISSTADMGNTIIRRGHAVQTGIFGSNNSIRRFYDIIPMNNMNLKATLRFYYFDDELNAIPEPSLHQWKSKDNINWDFIGADARDMNAKYVEKKSINKFERWTLATATAPSIVYCAENNITVSANQKGCKALVPLSVNATGIPTPTITYSIGNKIITSPHLFSKGTTTVTATASNEVLPNATCTFTVTVVCGPVTSVNPLLLKTPEELQSDQLVISARPNPAPDYFSVIIRGSNQHPVTVKIMDLLGRVRLVKNVSPNSTLLLGHDYIPGVYFMQATQNKKTVTLKLVKQSP